jgi:hypothetical protein
VRLPPIPIPRLADRPRLKPGATVAGTFECYRQSYSGKGSQSLQAQLDRLLNVSRDLEPPRVRVNPRNIEVNKEIVKTSRGDVIPQRFERDAAVPRRKLQLLEQERTVGWDWRPRGAC